MLLCVSVVLFSLLCHAGYSHRHEQLPIGSSFGIAGENATFDYVVVGAGPAGTALATRLAQDGRYSVALLEAGGFPEVDNGNRSFIPGDSGYSAGLTLDGVNPLIDWRFLTVPQAGANNKVIHYTRGKTLGGSSARNYMVYQRPSIGFFQRWADVVGDQSWTWSNVFNFYQQSSNLQLPHNNIRLANSTPTYNTSNFKDGPLQVGYPNYVSALASRVYSALGELGSPLQPGAFADGKLLGHAYTPLSIDTKTQERSFARNTYLEIALRSTRLTVYTQALATKINFDQSRTARSVLVDTAGVEYTITAQREIILSAGAFQSPQLLMVSGVGPSDTLRKYGINVVADRPGVGANMQDNPLFGISYPLDVETTSTYLVNPARLAGAVEEYNHNRTGFLTTSGAETLSFFKAVTFPNNTLSQTARSELDSYPNDWPDVQVWSLATYLGDSGIGLQPDAGTYGGLVGSLTAPLSRGTLSINSSSMYDPPLIDPRWLTHPTDIEVAIATVKRLRQIMQTESLRAITTGPEAYPGANVTTDAQILAALQRQTATFYHASGTCKMGLHNDTLAVVDSKARVIGVGNLRVVDLSAIPYLPPGQPQATAYMIGEKIAWEILHGEARQQSD